MYEFSSYLKYRCKSWCGSYIGKSDIAMYYSGVLRCSDGRNFYLPSLRFSLLSLAALYLSYSSSEEYETDISSEEESQSSLGPSRP